MPSHLSAAEQKQVQTVIDRARGDRTVPHSAQESIPFQRMFPDGICRVTDNYYTKTIQFQDINYQLAQQEDQTAIFEEWCSFLNFFDSSIRFELSFMNMATDASNFEKMVRIPYQKDHFNPVRTEYSTMLRRQLAQGNNGLDVYKRQGYDRWAAKHNLKQMAATVTAYQQYGFSSPEELDEACSAAYAAMQESLTELKQVEKTLDGKKELQRQVLAYSKTRPVRDLSLIHI